MESAFTVTVISALPYMPQAKQESDCAMLRRPVRLWRKGIVYTRDHVCNA